MEMPASCAETSSAKETLDATVTGMPASDDPLVVEDPASDGQQPSLSESPDAAATDLPALSEPQLMEEGPVSDAQRASLPQSPAAAVVAVSASDEPQEHNMTHSHGPGVVDEHAALRRVPAMAKEPKTTPGLLKELEAAGVALPDETEKIAISIKLNTWFQHCSFFLKACREDRVTAGTLGSWRTLFSEMDSDHDGRVTFDELETIVRKELKKGESDISDYELKALFCSLDHNQDSALHKDELCGFLKLGLEHHHLDHHQVEQHHAEHHDEHHHAEHHHATHLDEHSLSVKIARQRAAETERAAAHAHHAEHRSGGIHHVGHGDSPSDEHALAVATARQQAAETERAAAHPHQVELPASDWQLQSPPPSPSAEADAEADAPGSDTKSRVTMAFCLASSSSQAFRVMTSVPWPFIEDGNSDQMLREQNIARAIWRRDFGATCRIALGWVLNWAMLVGLIYTVIARSCTLSAWQSAGPQLETELVVTWVYSTFQRFLFVEPAIIVCALRFRQRRSDGRQD